MIKEIETRRSIRKYVDKEISKETLIDLLKAAMHAPTARNKQEWRYISSNNRKVLNELGATPYYPMLKEAGAFIIVMADKSITDEGFCYVDAGAATQNILLEAKSMNIGTCWCAIAPLEERINVIKNYFELPDNILPIALISIGYPNEEKGIDDRFDENKITWY